MSMRTGLRLCAGLRDRRPPASRKIQIAPQKHAMMSNPFTYRTQAYRAPGIGRLTYAFALQSSESRWVSEGMVAEESGKESVMLLNYLAWLEQSLFPRLTLSCQYNYQTRSPSVNHKAMSQGRYQRSSSYGHGHSVQGRPRTRARRAQARAQGPSFLIWSVLGHSVRGRAQDARKLARKIPSDPMKALGYKI